MEASGPTPPGAVYPDEVPDLTSVFEDTANRTEEAPFLTVVLTTEAAVEKAAQRNEVRWKTLRDDAAAAGAPEAALAAIDALVPDAHHEGDALAVIADGNGARVVEHDGEVPPRDRVLCAGLPWPGPILTWRQSRFPYLIVNADRTGADLLVIGAAEDDARREHIEGRRYPVHKPKAGGWSQRRFQQRAENTWKENAQNVADHVTRLVDEYDLPLVLVAAEPRAFELLTDALPERVRERVHDVTRARRGDGSVDEAHEDIRRAVATEDAKRTVALLQKLDEELGQVDRAVNGPVDTLSALARAQVDVLLVHDDPDDGRIAFYGSGPLEVAAAAEDLRELGVDDVREGRLADVAVRAAFGGGAGVRVVPHTPNLASGIGALLRWS
jgi:hypothetical protein